MVARHVRPAPYFEISERSAEVARIVRDDEVAGSIPAAPTKEKLKKPLAFLAYRFKSVHKPANPKSPPDGELMLRLRSAP